MRTTYSCLILAIFLTPQLLTADEVVGYGTDNNSPASEVGPIKPKEEFVKDCIRVCQYFAKNDTAKWQNTFSQNCSAAYQESDELTSLINAGKAVGGIYLKFAYKCGIPAVQKAGASAWDFLTHIFAANPKTEAERAMRKKFLEDCSKSASCVRSTARKLPRFSAINSDGSFIVPDSEVDAHTKNLDFKDLTREVYEEINRLSGHCSSIYNFSMQSVMVTQPGDLTFKKKSEVYEKVLKEAPYCPAVLGLTPPVFEQQLNKPTNSKKEPLKFEDLSALDQTLVGYGCFHDKFSEIAWDACSEGTQYLVGPPVGAMVKLAGAAYRGVKLSLAELRALRANLPAGHVAISQMETGILTRTVSAEGKISYQVVTTKGIEPLRMDPSGYAVSANNEVARAIAYAEMAAGGKSVMFFDVNNLGLVNYFRKGSEAGDAYLGDVAKIISEKVGANGTVYRWGGDEFMVVFNSTDPQVVKGTTQIISDAIATSPASKALFHAEKAANASSYKAVMAAESYEALPATFRATLTEAEATYAQRNFTGFKKIFEKVETRKIYESAAIQPSVSVGSAIADGRTPSKILELANQGASACKITYKTAMGMNVCKYTGRDLYLPTRRTVTPPRDLSTKPIAPDTL